MFCNFHCPSHTLDHHITWPEVGQLIPIPQRVHWHLCCRIYHWSQHCPTPITFWSSASLLEASLQALHQCRRLWLPLLPWLSLATTVECQPSPQDPPQHCPRLQSSPKLCPHSHWSFRLCPPYQCLLTSFLFGLQLLQCLYGLLKVSLCTEATEHCGEFFKLRRFQVTFSYGPRRPSLIIRTQFQCPYCTR